MRALPTQHVLGTLGQHALKAHSSNLGTNVVAVNERGVTGHCGFLTKQLLNLRCLFLHVEGEGLLIGQ